jgi:hypothetical protein
VVSASICAESGQRPGENCPETRYEVFISGTQPVAECELHGLGSQTGDPSAGVLSTVTQPAPTASKPDSLVHK